MTDRGPQTAELGYLDRQPTRLWRPLLALVLVTAIGSALIVPLRDAWGPTALLDLVYVPGIILIAIRYGFWWALATIVVTICVFDYAFVEPTGQFTRSRAKYVDLAALALAAALASFVARVAYVRATEAAGFRREAESEAMEVEILRRSDAAKTSILRSVSHDFRSPLTALSTAVEVLQDPAADPGVKAEMAKIAGQSTNELRNLVDNVLDFAKIEAGATSPQHQWVSIEEVMARTLAREPELEVDLELGELPLVRADPAHLERAFANLLQNARRHAGGLGVRIRGEAPEGHTVRITVSDEGPGIDPELGDAAFDPFRSGESESGSGLGLAIVRGFVEADGGRVFARPAAGEGAEIVVELPAGDPASDGTPRATDVR